MPSPRFPGGSHQSCGTAKPACARNRRQPLRASDCGHSTPLFRMRLPCRDPKRQCCPAIGPHSAQHPHGLCIHFAAPERCRAASARATWALCSGRAESQVTDSEGSNRAGGRRVGGPHWPRHCALIEYNPKE